MVYTIKNIAEIVEATMLQNSNDAVLENILLDSRKIIVSETSLFFAIAGTRRSGASFIPELYNKGVRNFVVDDLLEADSISKYPEANFLLVHDTTEALQKLAEYHRNHFRYPVIGITGSNGKTIVKEWLFQSLHLQYDIVRSPKSYNSQIGVPLSVWQMRSENNLGIFEAGISKPEEMKRLQKVINPTIGVLTFIGDAHDEGFENRTQKINEKLQLFLHAESLIYCSDNEVVYNCVNQFTRESNRNICLFSWGKGKNADLTIASVSKAKNQSTIQCIYQNDSFGLVIPFTDEASVYNAITCCAVLLYLGKNIAEIINCLSEIRPLAMRLELKQGNNHCTIINDSYSADISSLHIALDFLLQQDVHSKKTLILSDVMESGVFSEGLYSQLSSIVRSKNIYRFVGIGPGMIANQNEFDFVEKKHFFESTDDLLQSLKDIAFSDETILIKGARIFQFEKISKILEQKIHDTVLEINLNAIRNNLTIYRQLLGKNVMIMGMVKAFSYGSGSHEIANLLQHEGVDYLAVAYTDEGVDLRKSGIRLPIMVMNPSEENFDNLIKFQLEPEIYSFNILESFSNYLDHHQITNYPIHIKLDTGMHRLGFMYDELSVLCEFLQSKKSFVIKSVFSHLVASENSSQDDFTQKQAFSFNNMTKAIEKAVEYSFIKHLSNSAGISRHPQLQLDMVRLGIGLYGVGGNIQLQNVTTLTTTIAQIKEIKKGDSVGYGRSGLLMKDSRIATVRIGYADGYSRSLGNGNGKMLINGQLAPVIGNVCMDMTMLDITGIDASEGDQVIVFGEKLPVTKIAEWSNTIPYEVLTSISQRVKRVYFEE